MYTVLVTKSDLALCILSTDTCSNCVGQGSTNYDRQWSSHDCCQCCEDARLWEPSGVIHGLGATFKHSFLSCLQVFRVGSDFFKLPTVAVIEKKGKHAANVLPLHVNDMNVDRGGRSPWSKECISCTHFSSQTTTIRFWACLQTTLCEQTGMMPTSYLCTIIWV